ncbi:DUF2807 domain-containing protein [Porifericola rhodea]|uniref:head GIN domain-containing protein n=1 Tax=Porifericola rhodea TaxID=930972 RepID=UPI00266512FA|nr:head GIN domain-containing protein [Porifericola rhodea]WKN32321.1 DUF2807 domain-containing protein [Porifericola rhodea]
MRTLTLISLLLAACFGLHAQNIEQRKVERFEHIVFEGRGEMILSEGKMPALELEASDDVDMRRVKTYVRGNTLYITYDRDNDDVWDLYPKITAYVSYQELSSIKTEGIVDVISETPITHDTFRFVAEGMGKNKLQLEVDHLEVEIAGTADVVASGQAQRCQLLLDGTGKLDALELEAKNVDAEINGTGSLLVYATERLYVEANGFGAQVRYKGDPKDKVINKSGWVSVKRANE